MSRPRQLRQPRDLFRSAVWESESLTPAERLVALVYADHAGESDVSWVAWERLAQRTGIRGKPTLSRATKGLVEAGWLVLVEKRRQHRSPRYRIAIPATEIRSTYDVDDDPSDAPEVTNLNLWRDRKAAEQ